MKNLFFYSNHCKYSLLLIKIIANENMDDRFKYICIDDNNTIPVEIYRVPTLVVHNVDVPLEGKNAFDWVKVASRMKRAKMNNQSNALVINDSRAFNETSTPSFTKTTSAKTTSAKTTSAKTTSARGTSARGTSARGTSARGTSSGTLWNTKDIKQLDQDAQMHQLQLMQKKRKQQDYLFQSR